MCILCSPDIKERLSDVEFINAGYELMHTAFDEFQREHVEQVILERHKKMTEGVYDDTTK